MRNSGILNDKKTEKQNFLCLLPLHAYFVQIIDPRIRVVAAGVADGNAEAVVLGVELEGGGAYGVLVCLVQLALLCATARGVENAAGVRALDGDGVVLHVKLVNFRAVRGVAVALLQSVHESAVAELGSLDHGPGLEEMDGAVVVVAGVGAHADARASHLVVDGGGVVVVGGAVGGTVVDLDGVKPPELGVKGIGVE